MYLIITALMEVEILQERMGLLLFFILMLSLLPQIATFQLAGGRSFQSFEGRVQVNQIYLPVLGPVIDFLRCAS